jgi:hypothetical protein
MARFSGKIQSVKFVDTAEKTIEVLHGEDSKKVFSYILPLDYTNQDFLDLLEEYSIEEIQDQTRDYFQTIINHKNSEIYHAARSIFEEWLENAQKDLDKQDEERYKIFEEYKDQQLEILQKEIDVQVEGRFREADAYKEEQLKVLQSEIDEQAQDMKADLLSKFKSNTTSVRYTAEKVAKYIIDNFEDEDTVFKTKLEIFNLPEVKNSKDREMKMKVRKAKTVPEIFAAYYDIQHSNS